jgi:hypothetical protein
VTKAAWAEFEERVATALGGKIVPQSGGGHWAKLDVDGATLLVSCKWTKHASFTYTTTLIDEAERAVRGPGGVKGDVLPALSIGLDTEEPLILMKISDFTELVLNRIPADVHMSKSETRRSEAALTPIQRAMRNGL